MTRLVAFVASVALVTWAALVVPMPFRELEPGGAYAVEDLIAISASTGEVEGDLDLLTVRRTTPNVAEAVWVALHPGRDLLPHRDPTGTGLDPETYAEVQRQAFRTSFLTAVAVAAEQFGHAVELDTRAVVAQVLDGGPSDGRLEPGDVITRIDGVPVEGADSLVAELGESDEPRTVELEVERDGQPVEVAVDLRRLPDTDRPVLGIIVETVAAEPRLPFDATLEDTSIIGPSAGLMMALATADLLLEEDLTRGRTIAGTGTIGRDGTVGPVKGVAQKARAAVDAGADLLLVPHEQVAEAGAAMAAGIEVVGVTDFGDALAAVRGSGTAAARTGP